MFAARPLALAGLLTAALAGVGTAVPSASAGTVASTPVGWCATTGVKPCIDSVQRDGVDVEEGDPTWSVSASAATVDGSRQVSYALLKDGVTDLGAEALTEQWTITFDLGSLVPRVVTGKGRDARVWRPWLAGDDRWVTIRATPVTVSGQCDQSVWPWVCPEWAQQQVDNPEWDALLDGQVTDYGSWTDTAQRDAMSGLDYFTNVAATSVPPEVVADPRTGRSMLLLRLANRHFREDGTTVVRGHVELRIPDAFLQLAYGVPDPALMTRGSLATTVSGPTSGTGSVKVTRDVTGVASRVVIDGTTFSAREVSVRRGVVVPTRPGVARTARVAPHRGRVAFRPATPRGAAVTGYRARCVTVRGASHTAAARASRSPVVVTTLRQGRAYSCRVRALSTAGAGPWTAAVRMPARP